MAVGSRPNGEPRRTEARVSIRRPISVVQSVSSQGIGAPLSQRPLHLGSWSSKPYFLAVGRIRL